MRTSTARFAFFEWALLQTSDTTSEDVGGEYHVSNWTSWSGALLLFCRWLRRHEREPILVGGLAPEMKGVYRRTTNVVFCSVRDILEVLYVHMM